MSMQQPSQATDKDPLPLSVVVPIYNEVENTQPQIDYLIKCLDPIGCEYEVILVNDGSRDGTTELLDRIAAGNRRIKVIHFARNFGQTAAMTAGFAAARGKVIVTLDGDRQNEPADIPAMLAKLEEGYDLVSGWRRDRQDNALRKLPSRIANRLIGKVTGVNLHDYGCTLKAYRSGFIDPTQIYGEMHRFLPVYVAMRGGRYTEMVVRHHPRVAGTSKYGIGRTFRVITDLMLIQLLYRYASRPSHFFIRFATWMAGFAGGFALLGLVMMIRQNLRVFGGISWLASILMIVGVFTTLWAGLCAELIMRARHDAANTRPYLIARTVNFSS